MSRFITLVFLLVGFCPGVWAETPVYEIEQLSALSAPPGYPFQVHLHAGQSLPLELSLAGVAQGESSFRLTLERELYVLISETDEPRVSWDGSNWSSARQLFTGALELGVSKQGAVRVGLRAQPR